MKEGSAKYKTAKESGTLAGMKWNDFRKARLGASSRRTDNFGGATASSGPTGENDCRPRAGATGNAVFPTTVSAERLGWQPPSPGPAGRVQAPGFENFSRPCRVVLQDAAVADRDLAKKAYRDGLGREVARNPRRTAGAGS